MSRAQRVAMTVALLATAVAAVLCALHDVGIVALLAVGALVFVPLEHVFPRRVQPVVPRGVWVDLAHATITLTLSAAGFGVVAAVIMHLPVIDVVGRVVGVLPTPLSLVVAIVVADCGYYATHRLCHGVPWLWRFHRIHHSSADMYWLAAARAHPVDQVLLQAGALVPLRLMGVSGIGFGLYGLVVIVQNLLVHSNVDVITGPLRWIVATPEFHHWHHAADRDAWNRNFAGQIPLLDRLFGTAWLPTHAPRAYGIQGRTPSTYLGQLLQPVLPRRRPREAMAESRAA